MRRLRGRYPRLGIICRWLGWLAFKVSMRMALPPPGSATRVLCGGRVPAGAGGGGSKGGFVRALTRPTEPFGEGPPMRPTGRGPFGFCGDSPTTVPCGSLYIPWAVFVQGTAAFGACFAALGGPRLRSLALPVCISLSSAMAAEDSKVADVMLRSGL